MSSGGRESAARPYHHGRLRESLLDAALQLAREGGPDAVVLRAVSRAAGVSHSAAYRHFADHDELLDAVAQRCMAELAALMREGIDAADDPDPRTRAWEQLHAIGRAYVTYARTEPGAFRTAFSQHKQDDPGDRAGWAGYGAPPATGHGTGGAAGPAAGGSDDSEARGEGDSGTREEGDGGPYGLLNATLDRLVEVGAMSPTRRPGAELAAWAIVHGLATLLSDGPLAGVAAEAKDAAVEQGLDVVARGLGRP